MTEIAFHFNAPDKLGYVCRFVRKALKHEARVAIVAPTSVLTNLSARMWKSAPTDFLAHAVQSTQTDPSVLEVSPITLSDDELNAPHREILLNLGDFIPQHFREFQRVVEVVSLDDMDRALARQRWKQYAAFGVSIVRHDLVLKEQ